MNNGSSSDLDTYSIIIDSRTRISGNPSDFRVLFVPVVQRVKRIQLESVVLPFNFNNVTTIYGNQLSFTLLTTAQNFSGTISLPVGFYTLNNLIIAVNEAFLNYFQNLGYASPITLTFSPIPNKIILNYDNTILFGSPAVLTFIPSLPSSQTSIAPNYLFNMLGLNPQIPTVFNIPNVIPTPGIVFANPATIQLPISYVLLFIEGLPSKVIASSQIAAQFYIDISAANLNGTEIVLPNSYKAYKDYFNTVEVQNNFFSFSELRVYITDNFGQSLYPEQNVIDWHFSFKVDCYKYK